MGEVVTLWAWVILAAGTFCVVRGIVDVRNRHYLWGVLGIVAGLAILLTPFSSQAVKFDVPSTAAR